MASLCFYVEIFLLHIKYCVNTYTYVSTGWDFIDPVYLISRDWYKSEIGLKVVIKWFHTIHFFAIFFRCPFAIFQKCYNLINSENETNKKLDFAKLSRDMSFHVVFTLSLTLYLEKKKEEKEFMSVIISSQFLNKIKHMWFVYMYLLNEISCIPHMPTPLLTYIYFDFVLFVWFRVDKIL